MLLRPENQCRVESSIAFHHEYTTIFIHCHCLRSRQLKQLSYYYLSKKDISLSCCKILPTHRSPVLELLHCSLDVAGVEREETKGKQRSLENFSSEVRFSPPANSHSRPLISLPRCLLRLPTGMGMAPCQAKKRKCRGMGSATLQDRCVVFCNHQTHLVRLLSSFSWPVVQLTAITAVRLLPQSATSKRLELPG